MKIVYTLVLCGLLFACSSTDKNEKQTATQGEEQKMTETKKVEKVTVTEPKVLNQLPSGVNSSGSQFITGRTWQDKNGENLLVFSASEEINPHESGDDAVSKSIYAEHYTKDASGSYTLLRQVQDFEKDCILDNMLKFEENSINITDLDQDQYKEISFVYTLGCRSDISTDPMKLMLLENGEKYAVRGQTRSTYVLKKELGENATFPESTDRTFDDSFEKAPAEFKKFAQDLWNAHELRQ